MATFTFEPGLFQSMDDEQRRTVLRVIHLATTKTFNAKDMVPRTKKGVEAQSYIVDANDMLMDLYSAIKQDADIIRRSDGRLYKVDFITADADGRYASVVMWDTQFGAWRQSFTLEVELGETDEQARQRAVKTILKHDRNHPATNLAR